MSRRLIVPPPLDVPLLWWSLVGVLIIRVPLCFWCDMHPCACLCGQPHLQLRCVTTLAQGTVRVATVAGTASGSDKYVASALLLAPIVNNVAPSAWSTSRPTTITVSGERCGRECTRWCLRVPPPTTAQRLFFPKRDAAVLCCVTGLDLCRTLSMAQSASPWPWPAPLQTPLLLPAPPMRAGLAL